jgi:hypothetical protein
VWWWVGVMCAAEITQRPPLGDKKHLSGVSRNRENCWERTAKPVAIDLPLVLPRTSYLL